MHRSAFRGECKRWVRTDAPLSNVLMDGGCLRVPDAEYDAFLEAYARCVEEGDAVYAVERPSKRVRFYADFDVHLPSSVDGGAYVDALASAFARAAAGHLSTASPTVVLAAEEKAVSDGVVKRGVHMILPRTEVDAGQAEEARVEVMREMRREEGLQEPVNGWEDAFDASVYRQGGLRMIGSRKMAPCGCRDGEECTHGPARKVDAGRPYLLRRVVGADGSVEEEWTRTLLANPVLRARMSSIRVPDRSSSRPTPPPPPPSRMPPSRPKNRRTSSSSSSSHPSSSMAYADLVLGPVDPRHERLEVRRGNAKCLLHLEGEGSGYCPSVGRNHAQSRVYLVVGKDGVAMRCRCRKGTCPSFRGTALPLSSRGASFLGEAPSAFGLPPGFAQ